MLEQADQFVCCAVGKGASRDSSMIHNVADRWQTVMWQTDGNPNRARYRIFVGSLVLKV